jgi:hypothetical protein
MKRIAYEEKNPVVGVRIVYRFLFLQYSMSVGAWTFLLSSVERNDRDIRTGIFTDSLKQQQHHL